MNTAELRKAIKRVKSDIKELEKLLPPEEPPLLEVEKPKVQRAPRPIFDAIVAEWGFNVVTKKDGKRVGDLERDFKAKGATPESISKARSRFKCMWPKEGMDTPDAILKHWDKLTKHAHDQADKRRWALAFDQANTIVINQTTEQRETLVAEYRAATGDKSPYVLPEDLVRFLAKRL